MTKRRLARFAVVAAAAAAFALPAAPASAHPICVPFGTFDLICVEDHVS